MCSVVGILVKSRNKSSNDVFFFKQKTAYEVVSRDWSSDVCSSDLLCRGFDEFYGFTSGHWGHYYDFWLNRNGRMVQGVDRKSVV